MTYLLPDELNLLIRLREVAGNVPAAIQNRSILSITPKVLIRFAAVAERPVVGEDHTGIGVPRHHFSRTIHHNRVTFEQVVTSDPDIRRSGSHLVDDENGTGSPGDQRGTVNPNELAVLGRIRTDEFVLIHATAARQSDCRRVDTRKELHNAGRFTAAGWAGEVKRFSRVFRLPPYSQFLKRLRIEAVVIVDFGESRSVRRIRRHKAEDGSIGFEAEATGGNAGVEFHHDDVSKKSKKWSAPSSLSGLQMRPEGFD